MTIEANPILFDSSEDKENSFPNEQSVEQYVFSILEPYQKCMPEEIWNSSSDYIRKRYREFEQPTEVATSAFFVHTRRARTHEVGMEEAEEHLDDSARVIPMFHPAFNIPEEVVDEVWNLLPPMKVGEIKGILNGKDINCAIISVPITPAKLASFDSASKRADYARPKIYEAAQLAKRMGAQTFGLGETLAALTHHGKKLQEKFPEENIVTGHNFTTAFMSRWTEFAAENLQSPLEETQVTIVGANGSIGTAMTDILLEKGIGGLSLHDVPLMKSALEKKREKIIELYPHLKDKIKVTTGDEELQEANRGSKIVLVASSAPRPFIKAEHLEKGAFVINDSQPPGITREEAKKADAKLVFVAGQLPEGMENSFNSGLVDGAEWTCALEVLAVDALGKEAMKTVGAVDSERVKNANNHIDFLGMKLCKPQSWGEVEEFRKPIPLFLAEMDKVA